MDVGISAIDNGKRVANLRPAGDTAEIKSALGKDLRDPVAAAGLSADGETQKQTRKQQKQTHRGHSLAFVDRETNACATVARQTTAIQQRSAVVILAVIECFILRGIVNSDEWIVPAVRPGVEPDSASPTGLPSPDSATMTFPIQAKKPRRAGD
jgi:hypothetical protein